MSFTISHFLWFYFVNYTYYFPHYIYREKGHAMTKYNKCVTCTKGTWTDSGSQTNNNKEKCMINI